MTRSDVARFYCWHRRQEIEGKRTCQACYVRQQAGLGKPRNEGRPTKDFVRFFCSCIGEEVVGARGCKRCYQRYKHKKNPLARRAAMYKNKYGLGYELIARVDATTHCDCCGRLLRDKRNLGACGKNVDHDHVTGEIRGILCTPCNRSIGVLGDTVEGLQKAIAYLQKRRQE